jgi:hypothetical protein
MTFYEIMDRNSLAGSIHALYSEGLQFKLRARDLSTKRILSFDVVFPGKCKDSTSNLPATIFLLLSFHVIIRQPCSHTVDATDSVVK